MSIYLTVYIYLYSGVRYSKHYPEILLHSLDLEFKYPERQAKLLIHSHGKIGLKHKNKIVFLIN